MKFQVPQFIEVEDKIFGPLTFKQFAYLAGGAGFCVIFYVYLGLFFAILLGAPFIILSLLLAFYKVNNQPFGYMVQAFIMYAINKKLYLWMHQKREKKTKSAAVAPDKDILPVPGVSENKLKDAAWNLDIQNSMYENEKQAR